MNRNILIINTDTAEAQAIRENPFSPNTKIICVSSMDDALRFFAQMDFA